MLVLMDTMVNETLSHALILSVCYLQLDFGTEMDFANG